MSVDAVARAWEETAKLGQQIVQAGDKACSFFAEVVKEPLQEFTGMATDSIRFRCLRRLDAMADEVHEILERRQVRETRPVPPKLALPIFEAASLEDEPDLQKLWNELLANAMDPNYRNDGLNAYVEVLKGLSAKDAKLLARLYAIAADNGQNTISRCRSLGILKTPLCQEQGLTSDEYELSFGNLRRLQCVEPYLLKARMGAGLKMNSGSKEEFTIDKSSDTIVITPLGLKLVEACGAATPCDGSKPYSPSGLEDIYGVVEVSSSYEPANLRR